MKKLRQGFSHWCFATVDPATLFREAKSLGYDAVDLADESLWPQILDAGLNLGAMTGHDSIGSGLNRRENFPRIEAEILAKIAKAKEFKIPTLICFSGNRDGMNDETGLQICAENLSRVAPAAEKAGVVLAVELLNSKVDHADYQCDRTPWGVRLCEAVASPAVKLLFDIYHMQVMEGDLMRTIQSHHSHFAHYHTAGNPGRGLPDDTQEIYFPAIYRMIAAVSPGALVSHEFLPTGHPLEALKAAYRQLEDALEA
jgi:hydroxypyruvate isomerase